MSLRRSSRITGTTSATNNINHVPDLDDDPRPTKRARLAKTNVPEDEAVQQTTVRKLVRGKSKKSAWEPSPEDFPSRATSQWKVGPHVSSAGGVENAIVNAASVGANAFALFLKSQRKWDSNPMKDESIAKFKARLKAFGYSPSHVLPHGSYLVNLGNPDKEKREKSFNCFVDDLKRCEQLGLKLYNFHPGSTVGTATMQESITHIADCINRAHKETESVVIVLENMAGAGNIVGSRFSELGNIIKLVDDKTRVGVCLDTCHMYAAGYDITTLEGWNATVSEFEREVGMSYLRGMHLNDSKGALASKKDRHENIGLGHLGLRTFAHILADPRTRDLPLVLETPAHDDVPAGPPSSAAAALSAMGIWRTEAAVLSQIAGRAVEDNELEACRAEIAGVVAEASKTKDAKAKAKATVKKRTGRGKRKVSEDDEDSGGESSCGE